MVYRETDLTKIKSIAKDRNVVFLTEEKAIKEMITYETCGDKKMYTETCYSNMFFTEIKTKENNRNFAKEIHTAFKHKGFILDIPYWFD